MKIVSDLHAEYCETARSKKDADQVIKIHKKTVKQSEFFYQFFRSLILEFIHWDWLNSTDNIPRKVWSKVYSTLYPNGSKGLPLPQLGDIIMMPDSDWFVTENYVEHGEKWKTCYEDLVNTLSTFGFLIPNIYLVSKGNTHIQNPSRLDKMHLS